VRSEVQDFVERSTAAFREALEAQLDDHLPSGDPEATGRRAATVVTAQEIWTERAGPFTDARGVAAYLGITKQAVSQQLATGRLLGLQLSSTKAVRFVFPTWQFRGAVRTHLPAVLNAAGFDPARPVTGWTVAAWLVAPNDHLGGERPVEMLRAGHADDVVRVAREVGESLGVSERLAAR